MNSLEAVRFEILRLAKVGGERVCIRTHQLCGMFNVSENHVRGELAKLAEEKLILLAGWVAAKCAIINWPSGERIHQFKDGWRTCMSHCPPRTTLKRASDVRC